MRTQTKRTQESLEIEALAESLSRLCADNEKIKKADKRALNKLWMAYRSSRCLIEDYVITRGQQSTSGKVSDLRKERKWKIRAAQAQAQARLKSQQQMSLFPSTRN
jgi:hypothetical protein